MIFEPVYWHFADGRNGKSWRGKLARRGARQAYRDVKWMLRHDSADVITALTYLNQHPDQSQVMVDDVPKVKA